LRRPLSELAELIGGRVQGDPERMIDGLATLAEADEHHLSFVTSTYRARAATSRAGAFLVSEALSDLPGDLLIARSPRHALARLIDEFHPARARPEAGVHPTAVIDLEAVVDPAATVGAFVVIGPGTEVGPHAVLHPHVVVGRACAIGAAAVLHPHVVLYDRTEVGARSIVHAGVVLGADGYGFASDEGGHTKLRHVGRTVIEPDTEIGANTTVDRALLSETRIGAGTKIDNLVQVGHNARIGKSCLLVSQVGISGSTTVGDGVVIAGQSGVAGHLELGDGARVVAKSAVFKSVAAGQTVAGIPAMEVGRWRRLQVLLKQLENMRRRLYSIEKKLRATNDED
jgi:UDP-3-O-[3-hydroxymyristoyl] glucosamine N-acyltransferase